MEENQGYVIRQSVLFDNDRGFALGEHPREGFVTWQFTQEGGHRDYYWGHYHSDPPTGRGGLSQPGRGLPAPLSCPGGGAGAAPAGPL